MKALGAELLGVKQSPWGAVEGAENLDQLFQERKQWPHLLDLAAKAEIIILTCTVTPATKGMVNKGFIAACCPGVIIVNVARGKSLTRRERQNSAIQHRSNHHVCSCWKMQSHVSKALAEYSQSFILQS